MAGAAAAAAAALVVGLSAGSSAPSSPGGGPVGTEPEAPASSRPTPRRGAREDCTTRSEANFPGAFADPSNLVVGPLVLVGGAYTAPNTVREYGGNKFPLLVKAGHVVTVRIPGRSRRGAGLAYGPLPQGKNTLRDTYRTVTFIACRPGRPSRTYRAGGPSGSYADGVQVTFWSGFILTRAPACVPLQIYVDDESSPRRVGLPLGRRCGR